MSVELDVRRGPKRPTFRVPYRKPAPGPTPLPLHWFTPDRTRGSLRSPEPAFLEKLAQLERDARELGFPHAHLSVNWHPLLNRWQVWLATPLVTTWYCKGWRLLFFVTSDQTPTGAYRPLDARVLAQIWDRSARVQGSGRQYFDRVIAEQERDKAVAEKDWENVRQARQDDFVNYTKIKMAMCGPSNGSKFVNHHSE